MSYDITPLEEVVLDDDTLAFKAGWVFAVLNVDVRPDGSILIDEADRKRACAVVSQVPHLLRELVDLRARVGKAQARIDGMTA